MIFSVQSPQRSQHPSVQVNGVCFPGITPVAAATGTSASATDTSPVVPASSTELNLIYPANDLTADNAIQSFYLAGQSRAAVAFCSTAYLNITACQLLANLCTLQLQRRSQMSVASSSTCAEFIRLTSERTTTRSGFTSWARDMPWLYYSPTLASTALKDTSITATFNPNTSVDLQLAVFSLDGTFHGLEDARSSGSLQLCKESVERMRAAFNFGTIYRQECEINADELFNSTKNPTLFFDPYATTNAVRLMPIPVLNRALINSRNALTNMVTEQDRLRLAEAVGLGNSASAVSIETTILDKWELTRRFFLVDSFVGRTSEQTIPSTLVRFASNIELTFYSRGSGADGLIYPPLLTIDYENIYAANHYGQNSKVKATFSVQYKQLTANEAVFDQDVRIAMGVVSALSACYGVVRTWLWSRRAGVLRMDGMLILKLILLAAGNIANGFLVVIYCLSLYFLIFYKIQNIFLVTLPSSDQFIVGYLAAAFALKCLDLIHLLAVQCTVDIFLIDWERPRVSANKVKQSVVPEGGDSQGVEEIEGAANEAYNDSKQRQGGLHGSRPYFEDTGISIWRSIYVANEWNEIQTHRKTSPVVTLLLVVFFMNVVGFENIASADPNSNFVVNKLTYQSEDSRIFRVALILSILLVSGILQWFFLIVIWEKCFSDRLRSFADLCSVSNVSVFVLAQANFGYYIHGHSATGHSDLDLAGIELMLANEQGGAVPRRGITADTDEHTYRMALPAGLRRALDRLYAPLLDMATGGAAAGTVESVVNRNAIEAYKAINRFLIRFISRDNSEGLRYRIVRRKALEDILDGEFDDTSIDGLFYIDNGNSFGDVLYYGNETLLFIFDALLFCLVDLLSGNLILDASITWIVGQLISLLREDLGRRNVARKTLIDERFLI